MIVIDASVAVKWVLDEEGSEAAFALRAQQLAAPELWFVEAASALWSTASRRQISAPEAEERLKLLRSSPVQSLPILDDLASALRIANELRHPIYNCLYIAAALRLDTEVITADRRFVVACKDHRTFKPRVKLLGA
ncbi:MAG: type II toxin-antitoxin system VapC family toxin [Alphaproteobacteria bacterium]|nr:type II toxin-antitoxin system VapC family toxin [Alphaproteobacteria bacterium]